jgi:putative membrane protein
LFNEIVKILIKWLVTSLALFVAAWLIGGVVIDEFWAGLAAAALLGIVNAVIRPILIVLTLPATVLSLGLFILVINASMLGAVAWAIDGFSVSGFWSAFFGALIISVVSWIMTMIVDPKKGVRVRVHRGGRIS